MLAFSGISGSSTRKCATCLPIAADIRLQRYPWRAVQASGRSSSCWVMRTLRQRPDIPIRIILPCRLRLRECEIRYIFDVRRVSGSSPLSSTTYEKSELLPYWECVRIFHFHQRYFLLIFTPGGFFILRAFFIRIFDFWRSACYNECRNSLGGRDGEKIHHRRKDGLAL